VLAVKAYGEAEFWLSGGKVLLILILYCFTFITMVGGNPKKDAYGFRHWRDPGPMNSHGNGDLGRFEGFLGALWAASFCVVGPEYISMVAGEARRPRVYIKNAYKTVYFRFGAFFILGALCVGVVLAYNDPELVSVLSSGESSAAASPYVIAMKNLSITGLPDLVNALLITSIFSAGNTYTYCATRSLYSLAIEGRAPKFLRKCTKNGVPIYCFLIVMIFPFLAFLNLSDSASKVLTWLTNIITAGGVINYIVMCATYLAFFKACKVLGPQDSSVLWLLPTLRHLDRSRFRDRCRLRLWILHLQAWKFHCRVVLHLLYHGHPCTHHFHILEASEEDQVEVTLRG
jgi:amino acid transporter